MVSNLHSMLELVGFRDRKVGRDEETSGDEVPKRPVGSSLRC